MVFYPGGIISSNPVKPSTSSASGLWSMTEQLQAQYTGTWPVTSAAAGSINATIALFGGGGGATGGVASVNFGAGGAGGILRYANSTIISGGGLNYVVTVGAGGAGIATGTPSSGSNSTFSASGAIATGGNGASSSSTTGGNNADYLGAAGTGTFGAGGGAGAGGNASALNGGAGANVSITGTYTSFGGGGVGRSGSGTGTPGAGGGAGDAGGTAGTGGGAGGTSSGLSTNGGSGVVIINYPAPQYFTGGTVTNVNNLAGSNIVHTFTTSANLVSLSTPIDTYQPYNTLLLHADNANGYNNGGFIDSVVSSNTNIPFNGTYSYYFNGGTSDYLTSSASGSFYQLTGDFTIECWFKLINLTNGGLITLTQTAAGNSTSGLSLNIASSGAVSFFVNGNQGGTTSATGLVTTNTWYHLALVRVGSTNTAYLNGVSVVSNSTTPTWGTTFVGLGRVYVDNSGGLLGYISNVRIIKGQGLYTGTFTPPSSTLTSTSVGTSGANVASSITGTVMALTGVAPNYADYSSNAINFVLSGFVGITNGSNNSIARSGTPTQGTFSPFSTTGWSTYFNGSTDYFTTLTTNSGFDLSTPTNWTMECWVYPIANQEGYIIQNYTTSGASIYGILWSITGTGNMRFGTYNGSSAGDPQFYLAAPLPLNTWTHAAIVRNGSGTNNITMYMNGIAANTGTYTTWPSPGNSTTYIGARNYTGVLNYWPGYISNLRAVIGTSLYSSNFTPSTSPLTAIANTTFLMAQSNRFIASNSTSNSVTLTIGGGTPQVQPFSPFNPTAAYSNTSVGGSVYLDGSSYLSSTPYSNFAFGYNDFTIEFWVYPTTTFTSSTRFISTYTNGLVIYPNTSGNILVDNYSVGTKVTSSSTIPINAWTHIAITRKSNTDFIYINGNSANSGAADATNYSSSGFFVGSDAGSSGKYTGYISNLRVANNAIYTSNFTPSTTPLTATASTVLLLNATNAGIIDSSQKNELITLGTSAISNNSYQFGGSSIYLNGSSQITALGATGGLLDLSTGAPNWTVECWFNTTNSAVNPGPIVSKDWSAGSTDPSYAIYIATNQLVFLIGQGTGASASAQYIYTGPIANNTWYHVAMVRNGSNMLSFVNGTLANTSAAITTAMTDAGTPLRIGTNQNTAGYFTGYIDEVRITKGYARYTSSFTPPTAPFLNT